MTFQEFSNAKVRLTNIKDIMQHAHVSYDEDLTVEACKKLVLIVYPGELTMERLPDLSYYLRIGNCEWVAEHGELNKLEKLEYKLYEFYLTEIV